METKIKKKDKLIQTCLSLSSDITKLLVDHMWVDYDKEADVLYLEIIGTAPILRLGNWKTGPWKTGPGL